MAESVHRKLEKVRPPRVHISYDVEVGDAIQMKELPFVMGIMADLSGQPLQELPRLKDRQFVEIDPDNFDEVLKGVRPHVAFKVDNVLSDDPDKAKMGVDLTFESLDDFSPDRVAKQVEPLRRLLELRQELADLRGSLQGNDKLDEILQATIADVEKLQKIRDEIGPEGDSNGEG